jgi:transposase
LSFVGWVDGWVVVGEGPAMPTTRRPLPAEERAALEARRLRAAALFAQGRTQAEVARALGVSRQSAHVWHAAWRRDGVDALRSRGPTGPDPKLSAVQLAKVEHALLAGAMANGFDTDLWTCGARNSIVGAELRIRRGSHRAAMIGA